MKELAGGPGVEGLLGGEELEPGWTRRGEERANSFYGRIGSMAAPHQQGPWCACVCFLSLFIKTYSFFCLLAPST